MAGLKARRWPLILLTPLDASLTWANHPDLAMGHARIRRRHVVVVSSRLRVRVGHAQPTVARASPVSDRGPARGDDDGHHPPVPPQATHRRDLRMAHGTFKSFAVPRTASRFFPSPR